MINPGIPPACNVITLNWVVVHDFAIWYLFRVERAFSRGFRRGLSLLSRPLSSVQNAPHCLPSEFEREKAVSAVEKPAEDLAALVEKTAETVAGSLGKAKTAIGAVIFGQEEVIERVLVTIISGGHGLLVGVPGLAKTKLVETLGTVLGLDARRVQFTPDLMPSDIIGTEILDETASGKRAFRFVKGPVFAQLLMADEINRASPRTQSALLQAMQEYHVTVAGERHDLPRPFHVLATQNPIEQEGTYPLPEAQLDRFLMQIDVNYPDRDAERKMLIGTTGIDEAKAKNALQAEDLLAAQRLVRRLPVGDKVVEAILDIVRSARPGEKGIGEKLAWGPGPRASQSLMLATRARALIDGRLAPSVDDVAALAEPILKHRMALTFAARADGDTINSVIAKLIERLG
ncbi:MAG: MoxR family ATPase [Methylocystis sp.]|nr:MoxR family ATPase [Methylocystis sp.]MCA3583166.1 MoxR family ATPase [Methylocystis sp.]MCA3587629.1 MoxR family ATPase [Methylocystis sp.]MCA3590756.1 MoxR family ATPase [Methylocystis sp.]